MLLLLLLLLLSSPFAILASQPCTAPTSHLDGQRAGNERTIPNLGNNNASNVNYANGGGCDVVANTTTDRAPPRDFTAGLRAVEAFLGKVGSDCIAFVFQQRHQVAQAPSSQYTAFQTAAMVNDAQNQRDQKGGRNNAGGRLAVGVDGTAVFIAVAATSATAVAYLLDHVYFSSSSTL